MFLPLTELREGRGLSRATVATPWVAGHLAIRAALRRAAEWTIVHRRALAGLSAPLPAVVVLLAKTAMGVAVHSEVAAAIRSVASQVVTGVAEAADKI